MRNLLKHGKSRNAELTDNGRRSFIWKMGAGVSTAVASTAAMAGAETGLAEASSLQVALLEEEKALRKLHQSYEQALDKGLYDEVIAMFADDAEVIFNGGVFDNRRQGVRRLYSDRFRSGKTGRRMEPAPGFELEVDQQQDSVVVSPNRLSAKAVFPYSIQVGRPVETETSLASMARLQGGGVQTWWEGGVYKVTYARSVVAGRWQISRLEYITLSCADYRPGRTYAQPVSVSLFAMRYPEDPQGPDSLV